MRSVFVAALAWAACSAVVAAKPADGPSRQFRGADLFALQAASDPQVRPDGGQIAYVRVGYDLMSDRAVRSVWLVDPATGAQVPLAGAAGSQSSPRWSPDGRRLAYVFSPEGGKPGLYVRWMANGAAVRVADLPETPGSLAWSPDGRQIAFTMFVPDDGAELGTPVKKPEGAKWADPLKVITKLHYREDGEGYLRTGYSKLYVVDADGGAARQLTFGAYDDDGRLAWTPDGRSILFASQRGADWERNPQDSDIFRVDLADGRLTQLTHRYGPDEQPAISPDGKLVAYLGFDDKLRSNEDVRVYLMAPDGSGSRSLTDGLDRSVERAEWAADGKSLYIQYDDAGLTKVARLGLDGKIEPIADHLAGTGYDRPYTGGAFGVGGGGLVAFTQGGPDGPPDLAVAGRGGARRLTHLNADLLEARDLGKVQHVDVKSSADGRPIDAWLVTPANFDPAKKYPLILEIHGGPFDAYGPSFSSDDQLYAAAGYVVLYANPRGSTSYGAEFANLIHHAYPGQDYDDLMSAVDAAIAKGFVDPDQLYVTGGSGGGVLTAWIVGKTTRFRAAAVQKPVIDWASFALTSDNTAFFAKYWFGKMPWEDPQGYWARSPLSLVGNVKTPTMVVVGEQDFRTPDSEAEQYYSALQLRGVPTALVKVPGASHGGLAGRPSQSAAKASAILAWFERYRSKQAQ